MLAKVRLALRITTTAFDTEITALINAALGEMNALGIAPATITSTDDQILFAVIAYCKWQFGNAPDADKWERIYHEKIAQFQTMSGYGLEADSDGSES